MSTQGHLVLRINPFSQPIGTGVSIEPKSPIQSRQASIQKTRRCHTYPFSKQIPEPGLWKTSVKMSKLYNSCQMLLTLLETPSELLSLCLEMWGVVSVLLFFCLGHCLYSNVQQSANKGPPTPVRNGLMWLCPGGQERMDLLQFFTEKGRMVFTVNAYSWRSRKWAVPI